MGRSSDLPRIRLSPLQCVVIAVIALSLPAGALAVFGLGAARNTTADTVSAVFFLATLALLSSPWWGPVRGSPARSFERVQSACFLWFGLTFTIHLTWELAWLLFHDSILRAPDSPWAYPWWMYIDGGDRRYATSNPTLITQEILSVLNGIVGFTGLAIWVRSAGRATTATLLLLSTAVVHLYSTALYFGSEALAGYPSVDTASFVDFWIKFWLLNGIWLAMPWVVIAWGTSTLRRQLAGSLS